MLGVIIQTSGYSCLNVKPRHAIPVFRIHSLFLGKKSVQVACNLDWGVWFLETEMEKIMTWNVGREAVM